MLAMRVRSSLAALAAASDRTASKSGAVVVMLSSGGFGFDATDVAGCELSPRPVLTLASASVGVAVLSSPTEKSAGTLTTETSAGVQRVTLIVPSRSSVSSIE